MNSIKLNFCILLLWSTPVFAKIRVLDINMRDAINAPRWQSGEVKLKDLKGYARALANVKNDIANSNFQSCLNRIVKLQNQLLSLKPWLSYSALQCALGHVKQTSQGYNDLNKWIQVIESNKNWWLTGGQKNLLQKTYIAAQLELFDFHRKNRRSLAWDAFDKLMAHKDLLGNEDMADVLKKAGELAFLQQNLIVAYDYLTRSLRLKKDLDVNNRLSSIRELLIEKKLLTPKTLNDNKRVNVSLEASEKENQTYEQMKVALAAGDLVPAVEDGIKLINEYPSGERAKEATKKLIQIYMNISTKKGDQYQPLQTRLFNQMQKTNGREMYRWGKYLFTKSYHDEAQKFFAVAVSKLEDDKSIAEIYSYYGQSLVYTGDYKRALEAFIKATIYSAGTDISERTMFLLGLTYFQLGQLSESAAQFERLIAARQNSDYEVRSYYWLWRSLQSLDKQRAIDVGTTLFTKYPLTYYGLRARFEIQGEDLRWLEKSGVNEQSLSVQLTDFEYLAWEKAKWLLAAGWFEEAQEELSILPPVYLSSSKLVMAKIWNSAFNHYKAISLLNEVWELDPEFLNFSTMQIGFPLEYKNSVEKYGELNGVEKEIIWALIRQESSFQYRALSSAGAIGLMQVMSATAREVMQRIRLNFKNFSEEIILPENNIRIGTSYLAQMLRAFDGHLPFSLAAYNVGIGNMRKWLRLRADLEKQSLVHTSNFRNEIWIDELPWEETSHYVKAVLRNLIIYRMLAQKKLKLQEPIW